MTAAIVSTILFVICLALIFSEKINRTIIAAAGAALMVGAGLVFGFYSEEAAINAIDFKTLGVLFGMMTLVATLEPTGFFQYVAIRAAQLSRGRPVMLLVILGTTTTLLSMFLDNVTTVVLIAPVTILISEILGINPIPMLIAEALLSNTGGAATLIGDPPNILIGSAAGFSFNDFLVHSLPIVLFAWLAALVMLRYLFRKELAVKSTSFAAVMKLKPAETLTDPKTAHKVLAVLGVALIMFFLHSALHLTPAFVAMSAAAAALLIVRPSVSETLQRVDWSVLMFFAALFVMVGGLEASGALHSTVGLLARLDKLHPVTFGVILIWLVAILSAIVDNVPITIALIPILHELGSMGIDVNPLWWALVFGAGFGGNGTIIGSTANIVVVGYSERTHTPITSALWMRRGLPVMIVTCTVASLLYVLTYQLFYN